MNIKPDEVRRIDFESQPCKIKFSQDGSHLLIASQNEILYCRVMQTSDEVRIKPVAVKDIALLSDEQIISAASTCDTSQQTLAIYDISTRQMISEIVAGDVRSVCVDPHKQRIFTGRVNAGETGGYLDIYNYSLAKQDEFQTDAIAFEMAISSSGDKLAVAGVFFELWNVAAGLERVIKEYPPEDDCIGYPFSEASAVDITPNGHYAVAGLYAGKAACFVVNAESGNIVGWYSLNVSGPETIIHNVRVAISPNGDYAAVAQSNDPTVCVYKVNEGAVANRYDVDQCGALAFSPLGDILAIGAEKSVTLWAFQE